MWYLSKFALVGALTFFMFQNLPAGTQKAASQEPKETASTRSTVGPTDAVITVRGLGDGRAQTSMNDNSCRRVITREQFETLVAALNPEGQVVPPLARQNLAKNFADFVAVEAVAKKGGGEEFRGVRGVKEMGRRGPGPPLFPPHVHGKKQQPPP